MDWHKRDQQYVQQIKQVYKRLLNEEKPVRITVSTLGNRLGILANLQHHFDKLPLTEELLSQIIETVQAFQIRRACKIINQLIEQNEPFKLWEIQRKAAIKLHHFQEIKATLEAYI